MYMFVFILHNNNTVVCIFYLLEVANASSDSDAWKFDNRKNRFLVYSLMT